MTQLDYTIHKTKDAYELYINEIGEIPESRRESFGGDIPDDVSPDEYGTWLRTNAPIEFDMAYCEWSDNHEALFGN